MPKSTVITTPSLTVTELDIGRNSLDNLMSIVIRECIASCIGSDNNSSLPTMFSSGSSSPSGSLQRASSMQRMRQMVNPFGSMRDQAKARIDYHAAELNALSHDLWSCPETAFNEVHAHQLLTNFLEKNGFEVERNFILPTGFRATYGFDGGRAVVVIAEYDADPKTGHSSGHNLTAECAVGAALAVKAALESMEPKVRKGKIIVLGCPGEAGAGKQHFINAGIFFGVSATMMVSPYNRNILKPVHQALEKVHYKFHGQSADAGMAPWQGKNALDAAVQCYNNVAAMRQHFDPNVRVHGIFLNGGTQASIVPDESELLYFIRAPTTTELLPAVKKCEDCALGAAKATQCTVDVEYGSYYSELRSNDHLLMVYKKHCNELGLKFSKDMSDRRVSQATDMGNVSFVAPSIHAFFEINTSAQPHTEEFATAAGAPDAQMATLLQAKSLALTAIDLLQPGGSKLMNHINREFQRLTPPSEVIGQVPISKPGDPTGTLTPPSEVVGYSNGGDTPVRVDVEDTDHEETILEAASRALNSDGEGHESGTPTGGTTPRISRSKDNLAVIED